MMKESKRKFWVYIVSILIPLGVGALSALVTQGSMEEYNQLRQPPLAPPSWVFPTVWTVLFLLMGISTAMIWNTESPEKSDALFLYGVQLVVNFLWSVFYFNFNARLLAFFWLLFLLALVLMMTRRYCRISPKAGRLQLPYVLWLIFAGYLNFATYWLNR